MTLRIIIFLVFITPLFCHSQSSSEDDVNFNAAIDWLDSKLNYIYYDEVNAKWWKNTFYVNEKKEVTIKHISSDKPNTANIKDKNYTVRRFNIEDINPRNLTISEIKDSRGRIVKGKMLEIRTFEFQESINKTINNRKGSSTSFLYFSFPEFLNDSLINYAEVVKEKLETAIVASTKIYSKNEEEDISTVLNALSGSFKSEKGDLWETELFQANVLKLERGNEKEEYFGYSPQKKEFYIISIHSGGFDTEIFSFSNGHKIILKGENYNFSLETRNSFQLGSIKFFRQ
ncbi:hypothetical protein [Ekhidna sp.]